MTFTKYEMNGPEHILNPLLNPKNWNEKHRKFPMLHVILGIENVRIRFDGHSGTSKPSVELSQVLVGKRRRLFEDILFLKSL